MSKIIFSETAYQNGFGQMPWKTVAGLSQTEREILRSDADVLVVYDSGRPVGGNHGTTLRRVYEHDGRFYPRALNDEQLFAIVL